MFRRLYTGIIIRNLLIFFILIPALNIFGMTMVYRVPNQQKEKILDNIYLTDSESVLLNPIFSEYRYFYIDVTDNSEVLGVSDSDLKDNEREQFINYILKRYFRPHLNLLFFNVLPEDESYDHIPLGRYFYSTKLIELDQLGNYRIMVLYTEENADFIYYSTTKFLSIWIVLVPLICFISLLFAFWEVRPAKRAREEQREFFENASHELRMPITIISTALENAKNEQLNYKNQWMDILTKEANKMRLIVGDMILLAKSNSTPHNLEKTDIRLDVLLLETYISMEVIAMDKGVSFSEFECDEMVVYGNDEKLSQLASILLQNAIENTAEGGTVSLSAYIEKRMAVISVKDTGKGIDKHDIKKIFRRFYRADPRFGSGGNAGLGLSIADWIVKMHKGKIVVKSKPGEGSTFLILLPKER